MGDVVGIRECEISATERSHKEAPEVIRGCLLKRREFGSLEGGPNEKQQQDA